MMIGIIGEQASIAQNRFTFVIVERECFVLKYSMQ